MVVDDCVSRLNGEARSRWRWDATKKKRKKNEQRTRTLNVLGPPIRTGSDVGVHTLADVSLAVHLEKRYHEIRWLLYQ